MKKIVVVLVPLILVSCEIDRDTEKPLQVSLSGQVINAKTGLPIPNYTFTVTEKKYSGSGFLSFVAIKSTQNYKTNSQGVFSGVFPVFDKSDSFEFRSAETETYTPFQMCDVDFNFEQFNTHKTMKVLNWEKLEITLINETKFNEDDEIRISLLEEGTAYQGFFIRKIENFGVKNISFENSYDTLFPRWIGTNVNSKIYADLQNGTTYIIFYDIKRNGVWTYYNRTDKFFTKSNEVNRLTLKY